MRSFVNGAACALAIGPDDFAAVNILTNAGILHIDIGGSCPADWTRRTMAHELGHLLVSPQTAGDALEHNATAGNFMSTLTSDPAIRNQNLLTRAQSASINRAGAPLLVP